MSSDNVVGTKVVSGGNGHNDRIADKPAADVQIVDFLAHALVDGALPGEIIGFSDQERIAAAEFLASCASRRPAGIALIRLESTSGMLGHRRMRIAIVNDDMPFLVDSVANALAARGLIVHRLLHPVVCVERDAGDCLVSIEPLCDGPKPRESMMYLEVDRAGGRDRREIVAELHRVLADVRAAVYDWREMQARMRADAEAIEDPEGAALLRWFADGAMTLLGYHVERPTGQPTEALGLFRLPGEPTDEGGALGAMRWLEEHSAPLVAKADRRSSVHRRVPLDLVVVPIREGGKVTAIGVHAGLWTSEALRAPPEDVPVLRKRLKQLDEDFGFDPKGHSGKAVRHAIASLPRDLVVAID